MRKCGECTLCCKLLAVKSIGKETGKRCVHQRHGKGCSIYAERPTECRIWHCRWLAGFGTEDMRRPDRSHYVLDPMPDVITVTGPGDEPPSEHQVLQVWLDPAYPDAHRDPELRRYLDSNEAMALVRTSELDAFLLVPPSVAPDGEWHERHDTRVRRVFKLPDNLGKAS